MQASLSSDDMSNFLPELLVGTQNMQILNIYKYTEVFRHRVLEEWNELLQSCQ